MIFRQRNQDGRHGWTMITGDGLYKNTEKKIRNVMYTSLSWTTSFADWRSHEFIPSMSTATGGWKGETMTGEKNVCCLPLHLCYKKYPVVVNGLYIQLGNNKRVCFFDMMHWFYEASNQKSELSMLKCNKSLSHWAMRLNRKSSAL